MDGMNGQDFGVAEAAEYEALEEELAELQQE